MYIAAVLPSRRLSSSPTKVWFFDSLWLSESLLRYIDNNVYLNYAAISKCKTFRSFNNYGHRNFAKITFVSVKKMRSLNLKMLKYFGLLINLLVALISFKCYKRSSVYTNENLKTTKRNAYNYLTGWIIYSLAAVWPHEPKQSFFWLIVQVGST